MSIMKSTDALLVGSVPKAGVEDVFRLCASHIGDQVFALPDGEVGDRSMWIVGLGKLTYSKHPHLEPIPREEISAVESEFGQYRLKGGVGGRAGAGPKTTIDNLPYAEAARTSYPVFRRLRDAGEIPKDVRFQVALPTPYPGIAPFFPDVDTHPVLFKAFERGLQMQIREILEHIPADDLMIQWDFCTEFADILGTMRELGLKLGSIGLPEDRTYDERFRQHTSAEYIEPLFAEIPDEVCVGYHTCYSTYGGWPMSTVPDFGLIVKVVNELIRKTPHRVDFVHLPSMPDAGEEFFAPLSDLDIGDTRVFLGLELSDGFDALMTRARAAKKFINDFGLSHYCGYGREDPADLPALLADLRAGAEQLKKE